MSIACVLFAGWRRASVPTGSCAPPWHASPGGDRGESCVEVVELVLNWQPLLLQVLQPLSERPGWEEVDSAGKAGLRRDTDTDRARVTYIVVPALSSLRPPRALALFCISIRVYVCVGACVHASVRAWVRGCVCCVLCDTRSRPAADCCRRSWGLLPAWLVPGAPSDSVLPRPAPRALERATHDYSSLLHSLFSSVPLSLASFAFSSLSLSRSLVLSSVCLDLDGLAQMGQYDAS